MGNTYLVIYRALQSVSQYESVLDESLATCTNTNQIADLIMWEGLGGRNPRGEVELIEVAQPSRMCDSTDQRQVPDGASIGAYG